MGLIEKRLIKEGQENWVPEAVKDLQDVTGAEHVYEVDWDSFSSDAEALRNLQNQGLRRITSALRVVCRDDLGKESARETFTKVVVRNLVDPKAKSVTIKEKVLIIQCAYGKGDVGYFSDNEMIRFIEPLLQ